MRLRQPHNEDIQLAVVLAAVEYHFSAPVFAASAKVS
jgi:hypothetical protein